jgi:hypothetical protein
MTGLHHSGTITPVPHLGVHLQAILAEQFEERRNTTEHQAGVVAGKDQKDIPHINPHIYTEEDLISTCTGSIRISL